jgi:Nif-specific regulatory protein
MTGTVVPIGRGELQVGQDPRSQLVLPDSSVTLRHCTLRWDGSALVLTAVDGRDATFVNSLPVHEHALADGDEIRIGGSLFRVELRDEGAAARVRSSPERDAGAVRIVSELRTDEVLSAHAGSASVASHSVPHSGDLLALLRITSAVSSVRGLVGLERPLLELILDAVPSSRAALLLADDDGVRMIASVDRGVEIGPPVFHDEMMRRVLRRGVAVAAADESVPDRPARWLLAAPLLAFDRVLGAIWLERSGAPFAENHVLLLSAVASLAAVALDYVEQLDRLEGEAQELRAARTIDHDMVGASRTMRDLYDRIARVARVDSTVLIRGESGTGKELAARAIHRNSARAQGPFVAINCAAIAETLLESELFGHEKGAFTGAIAQKRGRLETAEGGTVLLDEIGELPLPLQAKLLRVIEERSVERVGGTRPVRLDFRLIAATNRDLEASIRAGSFRGDLYYRLNVVSLTLPPLRERREDIPLLARYFAQKHGVALGRRGVACSAAALAALSAYDWPGNVRELENAMERAMVLGGDVILPEDLPEAILDAGHDSAAAIGAIGRYHGAMRERKKEMIVTALEQAAGNVSAAARLLGLHPNYLHRLMTTLDLRARAESTHRRTSRS